MELRGTLAEGAVPGLLRELYVGRRTGVLRFARGKERHAVCFRSGNIASADPTAAGQAFGPFLERRRLAPKDALQRAVLRAGKEDKKLSALLLEVGAFAADGLAHAIELHVREVLLDVFSWADGTYAFEEQPDAPASDEVAPRVSTGEMILEAVRRVADPDVVRYALGDIDRVLCLSTDPLLRFQKITLTPIDGYVLSRVDGTLSAREVIQLIPQPEEDTQRSLFGLLCTGVVEYLPGPPKPAPRLEPRAAPTSAPAAPPPREEPAARARRQEIIELHEGLAGKNHFEILGIPRASSETQVKEAYFRLAKQFHPDLTRDPVLADLRDKLEAVFIRLGEAYEVLRNPKARAAYENDLLARAPRPAPSTPVPGASEGRPVDPAYEARVAEESVKKAEAYYEEGKFWDAIQLAEPALPTAAPKFRQRARMVLARSFLKNPNWVKRAEEMAQAVIEEDPRNAEAYFVLGAIYKGGGLRARAVSMYRKAAELRPDHEETRAELLALAPDQPPDPPAPSGGFLRKLLRRS